MKYLKGKDEPITPRQMADSHGICAYLYDKTIVLAREYLWNGKILSIQKNLLVAAEKNQWDFEIYIANKNRFYHFTTEQIRRNFLDYNWRGNSEMVNFTI